MAVKTCSIDGCEKPHRARGWCGAHWWRWRNHGDPLGQVYQAKECSIEGCHEISRSRTWCSRHYQKWLNHGDPTGGNPGPKDLTESQRFWSFVNKSEECWEWTGYVSKKGYAQFRSHPAHRKAWVMRNGPIPEGLQIDHICRNRKCVRVDHLRLVTNKQNGEHKDVNSDNITGYRGVAWSTVHNAYVGTVRHYGKAIHVGLFSTAEDANTAVIAKRNELFTHNNLDRKKVA